MKTIGILLILSVLGVFLWEVYSPLPDFSRQEFEYYYSPYLKSNVPHSILILYKIRDKESLSLFKKKYGNRKLSLTQWTQLLNLNESQVDKIIKFEKYIEESRIRSSNTSNRNRCKSIH